MANIYYLFYIKISAVYGEAGSRPEGITATGANYSEYRSYDPGSNLLSLKIYGLTDRQKTAEGGTSLSFGVIKDIRFGNVGSQMVSATIAPTSATVSTMDNSVIGALKEETTFGFNYDAAGNLTGDGLRKETFEYDRFGNPSRAYDDSNVLTPERAEYSYDASGRLHSRSIAYERPLQFRPDRPWLPDTIKPWIPEYPIDDSIPRFDPTITRQSCPVAPTSQSAAPQSGTGGITIPGGGLAPGGDYSVKERVLRTTAYCGNYEYVDGKLDRINTPAGHWQDGRHYFYIKDYQGNVRSVIADNDSLVSAVHYYPGGSLFGETYKDWSNSNLFQGGKLESYSSHQFYDLQNRHYDPILPHFTSVDKMAESYYPFSFYNYSLCNPVRYRDPDGNDADTNVRGYSITISADILIYNKEYLHSIPATKELSNLAKVYKEAISNTWEQLKYYEYNGVTYTINWDINVKLKHIDQDVKNGEKNNFLEVLPKDSKTRSEVTGSWKGLISSRYSLEIIHEFGHMLGLWDRYDENTQMAHPGWEGNVMGSYNGIVDYRNLVGIFDPILENYHGTEMQQNAIKHTWLNNLGIWDYNYRIDSHHREKKPYK